MVDLPVKMQVKCPHSSRVPPVQYAYSVDHRRRVYRRAQQCLLDYVGTVGMAGVEGGNTVRNS